MMDNEATLAEVKQKAVSVAHFQQKLTTFEELFDEATPEERKDLIKMHINYLIYTPDAIQLALFDSANETDRITVQREDIVGCPPGIRTPILRSRAACLAIRPGGNNVISVSEWHAPSRPQNLQRLFQPANTGLLSKHSHQLKQPRPKPNTAKRETCRMNKPGSRYAQFTR